MVIRWEGGVVFTVLGLNKSGLSGWKKLFILRETDGPLR